jgi:hypothetical protein
MEELGPVKRKYTKESGNSFQVIPSLEEKGNNGNDSTQHGTCPASLLTGVNHGKSAAGRCGAGCVRGVGGRGGAIDGNGSRLESLKCVARSRSVYAKNHALAAVASLLAVDPKYHSIRKDYTSIETKMTYQIGLVSLIWMVYDGKLVALASTGMLWSGYENQLCCEGYIITHNPELKPT